MSAMKRLIHGLARGALLAALSCGSPCKVGSVCNGNILETCSPGAGLFGPSESSQDCGQVFATCLTVDAGQAVCAEDPCDNTSYLAADGGIFPFLTQCVGNILFTCSFVTADAGFVQGTDCGTVPADIYGDPSVCSDPGGGNAACIP